MSDLDAKKDLHHYLQGARETLVWKLDGLDEYEVRRPLTPTGTNLLGLVKHNAATHLRYFGSVFGRPTDKSLSWSSVAASPTASSGPRPTRGAARSSTATAGPVRSPTPRSPSSRSTPSAGCRGGERARSPCSVSSCTSRPRPSATPGTPTSCAS